jgi:hypothetical protein
VVVEQGELAAIITVRALLLTVEMALVLAVLVILGHLQATLTLVAAVADCTIYHQLLMD